MISTGPDFTVGGVAGSGPTYSSVLMFTSLKTSQAGVYTCNATLDSVTSMSTTPVNVTSMFVHHYTCEEVIELLYVHAASVLSLYLPENTLMVPCLY